MKYKSLGTVDAVETGSSIACDTDPFYAGAEGIVIVQCDAFNGTVLLQTSVDGTTWTTHTTITETGSDRTHVIPVDDLSHYIHLDCTVRTAGEATGIMIG